MRTANRERESSVPGAAVLGIDQVLRPELEKAAAVQEDRRQGMMPGGEQQGLNDIREPNAEAERPSQRNNRRKP